MHVEYGPPGHRGVTQIMGLGASNGLYPIKGSVEFIPQDKAGRTVGVLAALTVVGGMMLGSSTARNIGIGGLLAVVYSQMLKPKELEAAPLPPIDVQGWG